MICCVNGLYSDWQCSPKSPQCSICPISKYCRFESPHISMLLFKGFKGVAKCFRYFHCDWFVQIKRYFVDIEDISCSLCSEWDGAYSPTPEVTKVPSSIIVTFSTQILSKQPPNELKLWKWQSFLLKSKMKVWYHFFVLTSTYFSFLPCHKTTEKGSSCRPLGECWWAFQ